MIQSSFLVTLPQRFDNVIWLVESTVKVKFEVSQYQESRNWKKFKCMELATGTKIGNEKSYCKGKNDDWIIYPSNRQTQVQQ
jgi:hypothetical protein